MANKDSISFLFSSLDRIEARLDGSISNIDYKLSILCDKVDSLHGEHLRIMNTYVTKKESNLKAGLLIVVMLLTSGAVSVSDALSFVRTLF